MPLTRPSNPSKVHLLLASREGRHETTRGHGERPFAIFALLDGHGQSVGHDNESLALLGAGARTRGHGVTVSSFQARRIDGALVVDRAVLSYKEEQSVSCNTLKIAEVRTLKA